MGPLAVPGGPIWAIYLEKEAGKGSHMTHNHLLYPGPNPGKLYPSFCAGSLPAHISPLNTGYGGTAALHYRHITPCEHPGGSFAPARPFTYVGVVLQENQQNWDVTLFPGWDRVPQVAVRHMWALPRFFFEICYPVGSLGHG